MGPSRVRRDELCDVRAGVSIMSCILVPPMDLNDRNWYGLYCLQIECLMDYQHRAASHFTYAARYAAKSSNLINTS